MSFSNKILLLFLTVTLGIGLLLSWFLYHAATQTTALEIKISMQERANYGIDKIDRLLFERAASVRAIAQDPYIRANLTNPQLITTRLQHYRNAHRFYLSISFYNANKIKIADTSGLGIGHQASSDIWTYTVYQQRKISIAEQIQNTRQATTVLFAAPILDENQQVVAAIVTYMDTDSIYQVLGDLHFITSGLEKTDVFIDLIDKNNLLLYSNYRLHRGLNLILDLTELRTTRQYFYTFAEQQGYLDFAGNKWKLIVHLPSDKAFASIIKLRNQAIYIASILLLIALLIIVSFARRLMRPIQILEQTAQQFGRGDFSVRCSLRSKDEIGDLSNTFNQMADLLEQQISQLGEFKTIFDISVDMIFIFAQDTYNFYHLNQSVSKNLGYSENELFNLTPFDLVPRTNHQTVRNLLQDLANSKMQTCLYETRLLRRDGSSFPAEISVQYVKLKQNQHYVAIARDISERKQNEELLRQAKQKAELSNQMKTVFLSNMSHELRTPLNGILGYTQILRLEQNLSPQQKQGIDIIHNSGEYLLTMIHDILDLLKMEHGEIELHESDSHLPKLLQHIVELFKLRIQQRNIQFIFSFADDLPLMVMIDEVRLRQILINLLSNALKSTKQGEIRLEVYRFEHKIRFTVQDTGCGISIHTIKQILSPLQQLDAQGFEIEGAGLGLSITKKIVELMHGKFFIESQPGQGTRFIVDLPLLEIPTSPNPQQFEPTNIISYYGPQYTIFIITHDWETRQLLTSALGSINFIVHTFNDYDQAMLPLQHIKPKIIIIELSFLVECLETEHEYLTNIIVMAEKRYKHHNLNLDYNILIKPIHLIELLNLLQQKLNLNWQYADAATITHEPGIEYDFYLSPNQASIIYDLGRSGDVMALMQQAELLKQQPELSVFAEHILQLSREFDSDAICRLVEPFLE
jgi:PAS domain S-box-containing protein